MVSKSIRPFFAGPLPLKDKYRNQWIEFKILFPDWEEAEMIERDKD